MIEVDRKTRSREYKETPRPAGIFRVRNAVRGKSLIGSSVNLPGILNRHCFQLKNGLHPDKDLQKDWNELGSEAFAFETLDRLTPKKEPDYDPTEDLRVLLMMWIEKLKTSGEAFYGQSRPKSFSTTDFTD